MCLLTIIHPNSLLIHQATNITTHYKDYQEQCILHICHELNRVKLWHNTQNKITVTKTYYFLNIWNYNKMYVC
jgi:hypothetical protein